MPHLCPLCARDDLTNEEHTDDGVTYITCIDRSHGPDGYVWEPSPPPGRSVRGDGIGAELDIWDKLLDLFEPHDDYVAYWDIEERLVASYPDEAQTLLERYGHRFRDPDHPSGRYTMSVYLACRLRELNSEGHLDVVWREATSPPGNISHWRLARPD